MVINIDKKFLRKYDKNSYIFDILLKNNKITYQFFPTVASCLTNMGYLSVK